MSPHKIMHRWMVVVGAVLIQLCLGAVYAWSVFTKQVTIPVAEGGVYGFSAQQAAWVFSVGLASFALVMVVAGRMLPRTGPRALAVACGLVLGLGYILGGFFGNTFMAQLMCIGLIGGAGIGIGYVVPIKVGIAWFPDKKGLVSGLAVAGFGFGATIWVKLAGSWFGGLLNTTSLFGLPGVQSVFIIYGAAFAVFVLTGSIWMVNPPEGYRPEGWEPPIPNGSAAPTGHVELGSREMLRTPQYWMLVLMFTGSALAGLMVIYCIRLFGIDALQASGAVKDLVQDGRVVKTAAQVAGGIAGTAMAWYAILNGFGRIAWGAVSENIGRKAALFLMCLLQSVVMLAFYKMGASPWGLIIGACIIGFNFGGNFALFPVATADFFGNKNVGKNYGWVFLAYGVAGIAGPQVAGYFKDAAKAAKAAAGSTTVTADAWLTPLVVGGVACLVAAVIGLLLKAPMHHEEG